MMKFRNRKIGVARISTAVLAFALFCSMLGSKAPADTVRRPGLVKPVKQLFSHASHTAHFEKMGISCTDCHSFAIQSKTKGPMGRPVKEKLLKPQPGTCHECHLGKIKVKTQLRNQCLLCHSDLGAIKPDDHYHAWRLRHGKLSQADQDGCRRCHAPQDCTGCHVKQNTLNPLVHRPNFRFSHSIQARSNPQSCVFCHKSAGFCMDCHAGLKGVRGTRR
ncbi:MAG: hypothetical protein A2428_15890 [Bdellovibrionales bacterium RIFOXYC1_FULL_54_43]|nr:MAG: hypothetical protein A2428_15890 [Bdellovibrionales bacterium RIFOXYC1_FULL_54_43]OFZ82954.1 MAG: hypothetical protein A2603_11040 [Bdellovibrionales bacterium RIFOXYD1_FULL_55_31]